MLPFCRPGLESSALLTLSFSPSSFLPFRLWLVSIWSRGRCPAVLQSPAKEDARQKTATESSVTHITSRQRCLTSCPQRLKQEVSSWGDCLETISMWRSSFGWSSVDSAHQACKKQQENNDPGSVGWTSRPPPAWSPGPAGSRQLPRTQRYPDTGLRRSWDASVRADVASAP